MKQSKVTRVKRNWAYDMVKGCICSQMETCTMGNGDGERNTATVHTLRAISQCRYLDFYPTKYGLLKAIYLRLAGESDG